MTVIKCTWAYVAVGGMTLTCLRALRSSFFTTRMWRALFTGEEVCQPFQFNIEWKERYIPITGGTHLLPYVYIKKTKSNLTTWNLNSWKEQHSKPPFQNARCFVFTSLLHQERWQLGLDGTLVSRSLRVIMECTCIYWSNIQSMCNSGLI